MWTWPQSSAGTLACCPHPHLCLSSLIRYVFCGDKSLSWWFSGGFCWADAGMVRAILTPVSSSQRPCSSLREINHHCVSILKFHLMQLLWSNIRYSTHVRLCNEHISSQVFIFKYLNVGAFCTFKLACSKDKWACSVESVNSQETWTQLYCSGEVRWKTWSSFVVLSCFSCIINTQTWVWSTFSFESRQINIFPKFWTILSTTNHIIYFAEHFQATTVLCYCVLGVFCCYLIISSVEEVIAEVSTDCEQHGCSYI